jgi:hypothetical protein
MTQIITTNDATPTSPGGSGNTAWIQASDVYTELGISTPTDSEVAIVAKAIKSACSAIRNFIQYDPVFTSRTEFYPQQNHSDMNAGGTWEANQTQAYFRRFAIQGEGIINLRHLPIRSVDHIYVDYDARFGTVAGSFGAGTEQIEGTDWWGVSDQLDSAGNRVNLSGQLRNIGQWPSELGTIKVIYTAGYTDQEFSGDDPSLDASGLVDAALIEAVRRARRALVLVKQLNIGFTAGPITSESLGDYSYSAQALKSVEFGGNTLSAEAIERASPFRNFGYVFAT